MLDIPRVVAIVQARMGASRLPNKMMLHLHGYPVVEWCYRRVSRATGIDELLVAIPDTPRDEVLGSYLRNIGATVVKGEERDVVKRFYDAAAGARATHIVRICADNPLISWQETDRLIKFYFGSGCDYAYNHIPRNNRYADGLGAEIASFALLERIHRTAHDPVHREHVFNFLWDHPGEFVIKTLDPEDERLACPGLRLDIDTYDDYRTLLAADIHIDMDSVEIVDIFRRL